MTDRVLHYYQTPTAPGFAAYMIEQTGLNAEQQTMVKDLRRFCGDTQFFAERAKMPLKRYNAAMAGINMRLENELLRLAQIGWETEQKRRD